MPSLDLNPFEDNRVKLWAEGTTVHLSGYVHSVKPGEFLSPFIKELHKQIVEQGIKNITFDVTDLEHLNSAGIREIVNWILMLDELNENEKYYIHFLYSSKYLWQESSISTFVFLNIDYVSKEVV